jgi:LacI family transcriptional regulator
MGVYDALKEKGLRIPDDVSVVGFDNQELLAAHSRPPLTTIRIPYFEMGSWGSTN